MQSNALTILRLIPAAAMLVGGAFPSLGFGSAATGPEAYDVIVAGGGPAGIGAGFTAAKRGAKTLVVERGGRLGGMAVSALVSPFSFRTESPIAEELSKRMGLGGVVDFHLADVKAYDLLTGAGAEVLLHADVIGPIMDGSRVVGLKVHCAEGIREFMAKVVIDATGDGVVVAGAGVPYEIGRDGDGLVQPMSIMFTVDGFDPAKRFVCGSEPDARSERCKVGGKTCRSASAGSVDHPHVSREGQGAERRERDAGERAFRHPVRRLDESGDRGTQAGGADYRRPETASAGI